MLVAISRAFDLDAVDRLLFLSACKKDFLIVSGDGLLHFARIIAAGMASVEQKANNKTFNKFKKQSHTKKRKKGKGLKEEGEKTEKTRVLAVLGGGQRSTGGPFSPPSELKVPFSFFLFKLKQKKGVPPIFFNNFMSIFRK